MAGQTIKEFASKLQEAKSESFRRLNPHIFGSPVLQAILDSCIGEIDANKSPRSKSVKTPEEKLNKTERRFLAVLRSRYSQKIGIQNITLKLSDDLRYTPDLNVFTDRLILFETKGRHRFREKGILKARWAAKEYPYFDFYLVTWDKDAGWKEQLMPKE